MKKRLLLLLAAMLVGCASHPKQMVWSLDNMDNVGGHRTEILGDPELVRTLVGPAVMFDGEGDRLLVDGNPVFGAEEFTVEIIFMPNDAYPANIEPRFFHIEDPVNADRRITVELRLNSRKQWYLDAFIKSEISKYTLVDEKLTHPVAEWAHAAITYKEKVFTSYVNGRKELSAEVRYLPLSEQAQTSIGARMNLVHWFNGAISKIRVTHKALMPHEFLKAQ
jgi:hypothetical protein